jgi:hypothetical protein
MRHAGLLVCFLVASAVGCGSSSSDGDSSSPFRPASTADVDAMHKAWCDWLVRCDSDYPLDFCARRRANDKKPELYAVGPLADLTACFPTLSCDAYEDRCVAPVAADVARSTPSRAKFLASCETRADECTGEGELDLLTCYWLTLFADPVLPKVEACMTKSCDDLPICIAMATR